MNNTRMSVTAPTKAKSILNECHMALEEQRLDKEESSSALRRDDDSEIQLDSSGQWARIIGRQATSVWVPIEATRALQWALMEAHLWDTDWSCSWNTDWAELNCGLILRAELDLESRTCGGAAMAAGKGSPSQDGLAALYEASKKTLSQESHEVVLNEIYAALEEIQEASNLFPRQELYAA